MARVSRSPAPLLSAALIVKDEEVLIERCLASLDGVVDEIVVLDTGSRDATVAIARSRGATVIEGDWHDDFSRARNECLSRCRGRWAVVVDADEVLRVADIGALRTMLRRAEVEAFQIAVDSFSDDAGTVGVSHQSIRFLRRDTVRFEGRLHEQVRTRLGGRPPRAEPTPLATIAHWGYIQRLVDERGKTDRNIRIATKAIEDGAGARGVLDLGRTLTAAGRHDEALARFEEARQSDDRGVARTAMRQGVATLLKLSRAPEALEWIEDLRDASTRQGSVDLLEAEVLVALGRLDDAVERYERNLGHDVVPNDDGIGTTAAKVRTDLGVLLLDAGRHRDGLEHLLAVADGLPVQTWPRLLSALAQMDEIPRAVAALDLPGNPDRGRMVLAELAAHPVTGIAAFVDALDDAHPGDPMVLAFAPLVAEQLDVEQSVKWSAKARSAGLASHCPLLIRATADGLGPTDRLVSAGLMLELFGDPRGLAEVEAIAHTLPPERYFDALYLLDELAPTALEPFVASAAHTTERCVGMAEALDAHGEREVALNVLRHGIDTAPSSFDLTHAESLLADWIA